MVSKVKLMQRDRSDKGLSVTDQKLGKVMESIQVHFEPFNTLRKFLVHPKDPVPKDKISGAIYYIPYYLH